MADDNTAPVLTAPANDPALAKTIADINAGVPAPPMFWSGPVMPPSGNVSNAVRGDMIKGLRGQISEAEKQASEYREKYTAESSRIAKESLDKLKKSEAETQEALKKLGPTPDIPGHQEMPKPTTLEDFPPLFSAMMVLGAIAGASVKGPLNASLGNMTGVLTGIKEGDKVKMDREFQMMKQNHLEAMDKIRNHREAIQSILQKSGGDSKIIQEEAKLQLQAMGVDKNILDVVNKKPGELYKILESMIRGIDQGDVVVAKVGELKARAEMEAEKAKNKVGKEFVDSDGTLYKIGPSGAEKRTSEGWTPVDKIPSNLKAIGAKGGDKLTVAEEKATTNYTTMVPADKRIDDLVKKGVELPAYAYVESNDEGYISMYSKSGRNLTLTDDQQELLQSIKQFAEGAGHLKSGARINKQTMDIMRDLYAPMSNDSAHTKKIKSESRKNDLIAAEAASGRGAEMVRKKMGLDSSQEIKTISSDSEYDSLPSGAEFYGPDGKKRRKP